MNTSKLFEISYIGKYIDTSIKDLIRFFEYDVDSHNNNIFVFAAYIPAIVSIVKRFALYMLLIIFVLFFFIYSVGINMNWVPLFYTIFLMKFFLVVIFLLTFSLMFLYFINAFFVYRTSSDLNTSI